MSTNTEKQWRVQTRVARGKPWKNKSGLFETRAAARAEKVRLRNVYGMWNTREVPYVKAKKGQGK